MKVVYTRHLRTAVLAWAGCFMLLLLFHLLVLAPQEKLRIQTEGLFTQTKRMTQAAKEAARLENQTKLQELVTHLDDTLKSFVFEEEDTANLTFDISQIANEKKVSGFGFDGYWLDIGRPEDYERANEEIDNLNGILYLEN